MSGQQTLLNEFQLTYQPAFHLEEAERCTWICDGAQRIGFFYPSTQTLDWWAYAPGASLIAEPELPVHYDMATRLNQHATLLWRGYGRPDQVSHHWQVDAGSAVLTVDGAYADGGHTRHVFRAWYDAEQGRYRWQLSADLYVTGQCSIEFVNYYPARMLHSHPEQRRFTHTVWRGEDGRWHGFPHNSAIMSGHRMGCLKYLPAEGAEFGMVTDPHCNPFCRVLDASRPLVLATCDQWWDEHLIVPMPSMCERSDGLFHSWAAVEWDSRTEEEATAILAEAEVMPVVARDTQRLQRVAFHIGQVCDFEADADLADPNVSMIWAVDMCPWVRIVDEPGRAHRGQRALAITPAGEARYILPNGANMQVGPGHTGRLTAWVNTERLQGEAWLELRSYRFLHHEIERSYSSPRLAAGTGWTRLTIEGITADSPYLHPYLWAEGQGEALFDEVLYEEIG